jgi:hypothetical protein
MPPLPPFVQPDEDGVPFYALAYCRGSYANDTPWGDRPTFLVLYFCTGGDYTRYSHHIVDAEGHCYAYKRGDDRRDTAEYSLLLAWDNFQVPPGTWRLFPLAGIPEDAWPGESEDHAAYFAARGDLCTIFYPFRIHSHFAVPSLFQPDPDFVPPSIMAGEASEESLEISRAVTEAARRSSESEDDGEG